MSIEASLVGIAMVLGSALLFSFNGLILRHMTEASALQGTERGPDNVQLDRWRHRIGHAGLVDRPRGQRG